MTERDLFQTIYQSLIQFNDLMCQNLHASLLRMNYCSCSFCQHFVNFLADCAYLRLLLYSIPEGANGELSNAEFHV